MNIENEKPEQESLVKELHQQQTKSRRNTKIIIGLLVFLLVAGMVGFWQYQRYLNSLQLPALNTQKPVEVATTTESEIITPPDIYNADAYENQQCKNRLAPVLGSSGIVEWVTPEKIETLKIFDNTIVNNASSTVYIPVYQDFNYVVGHVKTGKYAGGDFIVSLVVPDGPSAGERYRIIRKDGKYYFLNKYSNALPSKDYGVKFVTQLIEDKTFDLPDLNFPEKIQLQDPKIDLSYAPSMGFFQNGNDFFCADNKVKAFTDAKLGGVYIDANIIELGVSQRFGFYIIGPDGSERVYALDVNITGKDNVPMVTWLNGSQNKEEYNFQTIGGCGSSNFRDVVDVKEEDLVKVGTVLDGQPIFGYADNNSQALKEFYDSTHIPENSTKISYSQFLASHPIFFWKDPFGYFVRFKNKKYQPLAECGKPVIYLYPEKTQEISVKVSPAGGMSYSDPEYNLGWNVISDPNSSIKNLADGKIYPYLFWEGRGGLYETPNKGFVVEQKNVHEFLVSKLSALGLNAKETADFIEYWEPKMQNSPYYFVTFMGNSYMDSIAPLEIVPKPDTVIRILMDFLPLSKPINVVGYNIKTPMRKGFTVVEWGGVLR